MRAEDTAFRTIMDVPKWANPMRQDHRFVLLGSCFAQNIGECFQSYGLNVVCNPLGVTYNPASLAVQVKQALAMDNRKWETDNERTIFQFDGRWRCWWAGTLITDTEEDSFRETIQSTFSELGKAILGADFLFITLGTNVCYRLREDGMIVANCHKVPSRIFEEVTLNVEACLETLCSMMNLLSEKCPKLQVVFTVSPYRYKKYGFHGSQLAKATLLLTIDKICQLYPEKARYFPAYELVLDDLRDYRFYADDMIHPAPVAVQYIWQKMVENCMDKNMQQYLKDYEPIRKSKEHKVIKS